jgi:NAD(P)-dependent dehydrogenase (short-subunit alcohol dehydrogenase family)
MSVLQGKVALVTGASGGIGGAIAEALGREGASLLLVARGAARLDEAAARVREHAPRVEVFRADLEEDEELVCTAAKVEELFGGVDVLVHAAGLFRGGEIESAPVADLDRQHRVNVRVPYLLTQTLLPSLIDRQGEIVFINSSAGHHPGHPGFGAYAASKHALRALADSLRAEVNRKGVRVLTVFPGRTATPMQEEVHRFEGKDYDPGRFLRPEDVAATVVHALTLPRTAELTDLHVRPMRP